MKKVFLALALFTASVSKAQTVVPIQNPSFEAPVKFTAYSGSSDNPFEAGIVPGWTCNAVWGCGVLKPGPSSFSSLADGAQVAYIDGGVITQDLGVPFVPLATYTLSFSLGGIRLDFPTFRSIVTVTLFAGDLNLCSLAVDNGTIAPGTFAQQTITCAMPSTASSSNLSLSASSTRQQGHVDAFSLSYMLAGTPEAVPPLQTIVVRNPSFEQPVPMTPGSDPAADCVNASYSGPIPEWSGTNTGVVAWCRQPPDGLNAAVFEVLSQDLGVLAQPGVYNLKLFIANWFYNYPVAFQTSLTIGNSSQPFCEASRWAMPDFTEVALTCPLPGYILNEIPPCSPGVSLCLGGGSGNVILSIRKIGGWTPLVDVISVRFTPES